MQVQNLLSKVLFPEILDLFNHIITSILYFNHIISILYFNDITSILYFNDITSLLYFNDITSILYFNDMYMLSGCELIDTENISLPSQNMKFWWLVNEVNESQTSYSVEQANIFRYQSYSHSDDILSSLNLT